MKKRSWMNRSLVVLMASLLSVVLFMSFSGCGSTIDSKPLQTGVFLDSVVEGMEFRSGNRVGLTDADGKFYYREGETVSFFVGGLKIGETASPKEIVTPIDLVDDETSFVLHPTVTNICRLLQSLDADLNPDNGISISQEIRNRVQALSNRPAGLVIDFSLSVDDFSAQAHVADLLDTLNQAPTAYLPDGTGTPQIGVLTTKTDANKHFFKTLAQNLLTPVVFINLGDSLTTGAQSGFGHAYANTQMNGFAANIAYQVTALSQSTNWNNPLLSVEEENYNEENDFKKILFRIVDNAETEEYVEKYNIPHNLGVPGATIKSVIETRTAPVDNDLMNELFRPLPELIGAAREPAIDRVELSQLEAALYLADRDENKNRLKLFTLWIGAEDTLGVVTKNLGSDLTTANITDFLNDTTAGHDLASVTANLTEIVDQLRAVEYAYVFIATIPHVESIGTLFGKNDIEKMARFGLDTGNSADIPNVTALSTELIGFTPFVGDFKNPDPETSISRCLSNEAGNDNTKLNANIAQLLLDDANYLDDAEIAMINNRINAVNTLIKSFGSAYENVIVVDVDETIYEKLDTDTGYNILELVRSADFALYPEYDLDTSLFKTMSGGFYSLDGFHPGHTGYGAIGFLFTNAIDAAGIGLAIDAEYDYMDGTYPALDFEITDVQVLDPFAYDEDGDGYMIALPVTAVFPFHTYDAVTLGGWVDCDGSDETILPYYVAGLQFSEGDTSDTSDGLIDFGLCNGYLPAYSAEE